MNRTRFGFVILLALAAPLHAEEKPQTRERVPPEGIDGVLVLSGEIVPDAALDRFLDLAGKDKAEVILLVSGDDVVRPLLKKLTEACKAKMVAAVVLTSEGGGAKTLESLRKATGVWLIDAPSPGTDLEKEVRGVLKRGGVVGAAGNKASLGLLPGLIYSPHLPTAEGKMKLFDQMSKVKALFGLGIVDGSALVVRGRQMNVLGEGTVIVGLPKSANHPQRTIEITPKSPSDLTMIFRAAKARAADDFPPKIAPVPEVEKGSLVIVGGGGMPEDVTKKFIELAGGPDALIVVLPTANPEPLPMAGAGEGAFFKRAGAKNVIILNARKLDEVNDPKTLEIVKKAGGVWFGGGRQWRFVDAYEGTKMEDAFREVLKRGGVIGGSSAGASIQGHYMCRGSPLGNLEIMCEGYERGLGFLPGTAIDQHFAQRKRFADMTELVKTYPQLLGIGLDEATALIVRGHVADIMGRGEAHFYDSKKPVEKDKPDHESIKAGGRYDLKERKPL